MENNVGDTDQIVRIALGAVTGLASIGILTNYINQPEIYSALLGIISLVLLATGFTGRCGLYSTLGINTCKVE